jgi:proteasome lid subunit RPN8/RPN11
MASEKKSDSKAKGYVPPDPELRIQERSSRKPTFCDFPGPSDAKAPLRVAMTKEAYAQITSHAAGSLDAEICGVLAGTQCEDDNGPFLKVSAAVRGDTAKRGSTHVTFTHETWDVIHKTMEKDHPKLDIVGWYHSHPGFGVEFSEMDIFIQKNFFKAETQVALVVDPLGGQTAMCVDTSGGLKYIDRFWVDGREHKCQTPRRSAAIETLEGDDSDAPVSSSEIASMKEMKKTLELVQNRLTQAIQMVDEQRSWIYRTVLMFGMVICTLVIFWIGGSLWRAYTAPLTPPEGIQFLQVPLTVDGKVVLVGIQAAKWQVPPELVADIEKMQQQKKAAEAAATQKAAKEAASSQPTSAPAAP